MTHQNTSIDTEYEYDEFNSSKRSKFTSKVWEDMLKIQTSEGSKAQCKHCGKLLQDNCGTSHLKRHLVRCIKRPKTVDGADQELMSAQHVQDTGIDKEFEPNMVYVARPLKTEPAFPETPNSQGSNVTDSATGREQHSKTKPILGLANIESPKNQIDLTLDDSEMREFYASLDAETLVVSPPQDIRVISEVPRTLPCEETEKALKTLQDFLSKDFSAVLHSEVRNSFKSTLEYLSNLTNEDGISLEVRLLISQVSKRFTQWGSEYNNAGRQIECASTNLLKADKLEENLEANKNQFKELASLESELSSQLARLVEKKRELEEQLSGIKANLSVFQSAKNTATKRKREIFEEGKTLKAQRDELKGRAPYLRDEWESAKKMQANIKAEWSELAEKFNQRLDGVQCKYFISNNRHIDPSEN